MNNTLSDKLLINLKILSKIQKNGRICRSYDGIISLENDAMYQFIKRFLTNDSRRQAVSEINSIITECIDTIGHIFNSKYTNVQYKSSEEYYKNCESLQILVTELELAKTGIENLKFTYNTDQNIISQLDIIILKIVTTLRDTKSKLGYFQSFLSKKQNQYFEELNSVRVDEFQKYQKGIVSSTVEYDLEMESASIEQHQLRTPAELNPSPDQPNLSDYI